MPRIVSAIAIAAALIIGVFIIKERGSTSINSTTLIAEQIQNANQSSLQAYAAELQESGSASDTTIAIPPILPDISTTTLFAPPTATDRLAQNILETYINTKQSGVDISSDVATQIADNVTSESYAGSDQSKIYSVKDLNVEQLATTETLKNYGNAVGSTLSTPPAPNERYELSVFEDFANSNDASILSSLSLNITRYQKMISKLITIPVPGIFLNDHINLVNALSGILFDVQKMQNFPTDPVGGLNAISHYQTATQSLASAISAEKSLFAKENVVFSSTDTGNIFAN